MSGTFRKAEKKPVLEASAKPIPGRVLVVEDREELRRRFVTALLGKGYRAVGVATLREAIEALESDARFDALVCELKLADGLAFGLIERVARLEPPPVTAVITAHLDANASLRLARLGVFYFPKPFAEPELDELMQMVEQRRTGVAEAYAALHLLSPRETEALRHSLERRPLRKAALLMGISSNTLKEYWLRIFEKTGLRSQADVVRDAALKLGRSKDRR